MGGNVAIDEDIKFILDKALKQDSSAIHIDDMDKYILIRYRVDGRLEVGNKLNKKNADIIDKIFNWLDLEAKDVFNEFSKDYLNCKLIINVLPSIYGYKITIKISQVANKKIRRINQIGLSGNNLKELNLTLGDGRGVIIITSSYTQTVEDINESILSNISSTSKILILKNNDLSKYSRLDSDDYEVISAPLVSRELATLSADLSRNKLIILRLNSESRIDLLSKLSVLGYRNAHLNNSVKLILNFRFVKKHCPYCAESKKSNIKSVSMVEKALGIKNGLNAAQIEKLKQSVVESMELGNSEYKLSKGCERCNYSSYYGYIGLFETLKVEIRKNKFALIKLGETMEIDGLIKALLGLIELKDVIDIR